MESTEDWVFDERSYVVTAVTEASRVGAGWDLAALRLGKVLEVFRDDSAAVPVIGCRSFRPVPQAIVAEFTHRATADLLSGVLNQDHTGWLAENVGRALALTGRNVLGWSGMEWAIPTGADDEILWSDGERVPFAWLVGQLTDGDLTISTYQDGADFGLRFEPTRRDNFDPTNDELRPHAQAPLPIGTVEAVEVVIDDSRRTEGGDDDAILSEVTLHIDGESVLLMAAEAEAPDVWKLYDESVVVLRDPSAADRLTWFQPRPNRRT